MAAPVYKPPGIRSAKSFGSEEARDNAHRRGYGGRRWEITRRRIFLRDDYICQECGQVCIEGCDDHGRRPHCDHIIPKPQGGDQDDNLQTLCGSCHSVKTVKEKGGRVK